ncbi:MAG TPA: NAD-dependent epimerase/dehydratase family protein [Thermoplasmata archaeon]|nr:NAD-dependent epimerase/dehydratase family protein [Thermoplasmata archaeon]
MTNKERYRKVLVTGAGGFIGHHLVKVLKKKGFWVRGADIKRPDFEPTPADEFLLGDLRVFQNCERAVKEIDDAYGLAADMGGIGYITAFHANLARNNVLINSNMLEAAHKEGVSRYLYSSSACVYPSFRQNQEENVALREEDALPADPEKGYGWEKLFSEQLATYYFEDHGLDVRIVRFHNVYGPLTTYEGGREKAPAAICRKVAEADDGAAIEVWGDGNQTRSFCYIDDCTDGVLRIMDSDYRRPLNLGTEELVSVNDLVDLTCNVGGKRLRKVYKPGRPQGVRGRNSDNALLRRTIGWEPKIPLRAGLEATYEWVWQELDRQGRARPPGPLAVKAA